MRVVIDQNRCLGNELCLGVAPEAIETDEDGLARPRTDQLDPDLLEQVREAARLCPTQAIAIEE